MGDKGKSVGKWSPASIKKVTPLKGEPTPLPKPGRLWEAAKKIPVVKRAVLNSNTKTYDAEARETRAQTGSINADTERTDALIQNKKKDIEAGRYTPSHINLDVTLQDQLADIERQRAKLKAEEELENLKHQAELDRRRREEELNPPEPAPKPRQPTAKERAEAEAERLRKTGTTTMHGEIARKQLDEMKTQLGEDEEKWSPEQQEIARDLRMWALRGGK